MKTTIKHGSLAFLVSLLMAGCGSDEPTDQVVSASFTPIPLKTFTVTNIRRDPEARLIGWAADDFPVYAVYDYSDDMESLTADYEYLAGYGELVSRTH